jgi:translation initiation factor IF-2
MALRLVKIAKELNVATSTIVEYLSNAGFQIENKPTAKVSDEMYQELQKEFSSSVAEKEKADKLIIGRVATPKKEVVEQKPVTPPPPPAPPVEKAPVVEKPVETPPAKDAEEVPKVKSTNQEEPKKDRIVPGLKVLGKIDLDANKRKPKPPKEEPKKEVKQEVVVPKKEEKPPVKKETSVPAAKSTTDNKPPESTPKKDEVIREQAPQ